MNDAIPDNQVTSSEFDVLNTLGLSQANEISLKKAPGMYRMERQQMNSTSTIAFGNEIDLELKPSHLVVNHIALDFQVTFSADAVAAGEDFLQPPCFWMHYIELRYNNIMVERYDPDQLWVESVLMDAKLPVDDYLSARESNFYDASAHADAVNYGFSHAANTTKTVHIRLVLPNADRIIRAPISSYPARWSVVCRLRSGTDLRVIANSGGNAVSKTVTLDNFTLEIEGFRVPEADVKRAFNIIKSMPFKYIWPTIIKKRFTTGATADLWGGSTQKVTFDFSALRGRLQHILIGVEPSGRFAQATPSYGMLKLHSDGTRQELISIGTFSDPDLFTRRPIPLTTVVYSGNTTYKQGVQYVNGVPKFLNWYVWSLSDSIEASYKSGISNGSATQTNSLVISLDSGGNASSLAANTTYNVIFMFYLRKESKMSDKGVSMKTRFTEIDQLETEQR